MPKAIIYIRVSTEEQAQNNTSLEDQRNRGKLYAAMRGLEVAGVYEDAGLSGTRYETRPALMEALAAIERKDAEILIVLKIDRLGRSASVILQIAKRIDRAGGQLVTCDGQEFGGTPIGKMLLTMFAGMAEFEKDNIRERMQRGKQARAASGSQPMRVTPPFGYHIVTRQDIAEGLYPPDAAGTYQIVEATAPIVREMFTLYESGLSLRAVTRHLDAQGVPPPKGGNQWNVTSVTKILRNSIYKGEAVYGRDEITSGEDIMQTRDPSKRLVGGRREQKPESQWTRIAAPSLVDAQQWERVRVRLESNVADRQALLGGNPGRKWMLSGLTHCPTCGFRLRGTKMNAWGRGRVEYYVCENKKSCAAVKRNFAAEKLEAMLRNALRYVAERPESVRAAIKAYESDRAAQQAASGTEATRSALQAKLAELETDLKNTKRAMLAAIRAGLSEDDFAGELEAIATKRKRIESQIVPLASLPASPKETNQPDAAAILARLAEATERVLSADRELFSAGEKQALLARIIERITPTLDGIGAEIRLKSETVHSVLTVALAEHILTGIDYVDLLHEYFRRYPSAGYGGAFFNWAYSELREPYNSWGNGSAMRVSPVGWAFDTLDDVLREAERSAAVTHNHPEGIKGAQAVASSVFLARTGAGKPEIRDYIEATFQYNLSDTTENLRRTYHFDVSCQGSVPQALIAFLESSDYENAVRLGISLGGDSDTIGCMTGAVAEAFYGGVPEDIKTHVYARLDPHLTAITRQFCERYGCG